MIVAPVIMLLIGLYLVLRRFGDRFPQIPAGRVVGITLAYLNALDDVAKPSAWVRVPDANALVEQGGGGGIQSGKGILEMLVNGLGNAGAVIVLVCAMGARLHAHLQPIGGANCWIRCNASLSNAAKCWRRRAREKARPRRIRAV